MIGVIGREAPVAAAAISGARVESVTVDGAYHRIRIAAPGLAASARPGQFLAVLIADGLSMPLRRYFSILRTASDSVEFVCSVHSPATHWLSQRRRGDELDVFGPLGRTFPELPSGSELTLVAGGHGAAALLDVAVEALRRDVRVSVVLGAPTAVRLFGAAEFARAGAAVQVCTEDGSLGRRGRVTEAAKELIERGSDALFACGPMPMLAVLAELAAGHRTPCWVSTEVPMACAIGVCMTCVLPMRDGTGPTTMSRACVEGPVLSADRVRWDQLGKVPDDCVGAS